MYYSRMMQGFQGQLEFWPHSGSLEGLFRAGLCFCSWIDLDIGRSKFVMLEDENSCYFSHLHLKKPTKQPSYYLKKTPALVFDTIAAFKAERHFLVTLD